MNDVEAVATILRALADARNGPFYALWIDLLRAGTKPQPEIGFRVFRAAGPTEAESRTVIGVSGVRPDGRSVSWSISLDAGSELRITARVEIDEDDGGSEELYEREQRAHSASAAADAISALTEDVCARREWWQPETT